MRTDYIPASDAGFDAFQDNFYNGVQPKLMLWGIPGSWSNEISATVA